MTSIMFLPLLYIVTVPESIAWNCFNCGNNNFQFRAECNKCKLPKKDAQSDRFRLLEGNKTGDEPGEVSADNSDN